MAGLSFNLLDQLSFYGSYHSNKWNKLIHFVFVPTIVWTVLVWCAYTGPILPTPHQVAAIPLALQSLVQLNGAFFVTASYSLFYLALEPLAGLSWTLFVGLPLWLGATAFVQHVVYAWAWAVPIHLFAWYMQIHPGHMLLEGRKPALLDSLVQAFALAPLFVWFELLFLLGYRPQLNKDLEERVDAAIALHKSSQPQHQQQQQPLLERGPREPQS